MAPARSDGRPFGHPVLSHFAQQSLWRLLSTRNDPPCETITRGQQSWPPYDSEVGALTYRRFIASIGSVPHDNGVVSSRFGNGLW